MLRPYQSACLLIAVLGFFFTAKVASAQVESAQPPRQLITQAIDVSKLVTLAGNTRPEAIAANDQGAVAADLPMEHMQLQLQLPIEKEQQLEQFIQELQDPTSAYFHQWLTPEQFRQDFSLAPEDIEIITSWLQSKGFAVNVIYPRSIDFSGTAAQVQAAFRTEIHHLDVNGVMHIANMSDPRIPAALAPAIVGVMSLNDFKPRPANLQRVDYTTGSGDYLVVPADLATIYDFNPIFSKGVSGQGQTIVVIEDTDLYTTSDWTTFRSVLGLSGYTAGSFSTVHPAPPSGTNNCTDPGVNSDDDEAILDAEWTSAAAPSAAIVLASCTGIGGTTITSFGGFIALQNLLNESATPPAIVSISYGESESEIGATTNAAISALYQQAVTEGVSVFVSSGDEGAASSDADLSKATHGVAVSGYTSTPYNVSVGGTDFGDTYTKTNSTYWGATNSSTYGSALSYIPEIPWNDSCAGQLLATYAGYAATYGSSGFCNSSTGEEYLTTAAGSGGPSGCATGTPGTSGVVSGTCAGYAKPSWQSVLGNPSDGVRDIPDVSLFAANGVWGHYYVACFSDSSNGGKSCAGTPNTWAGYGGTSISTPIMAAIQALANQTVGSSAGNPDTTYYALAQSEYGAGGNSSCNSSLGNTAASTCIFYDVTAGDMDVNCTGTHSCYLDSATHGVLSLSDTAYQLAYGTNTGWDFATGIGTVNANNFVSNWPKPSNPAALSITSSHSGNFTQGQQNATYTLTVSNGASANPTSGTVTVTDALPSGLTLVSMTGSGWTCATTTCTRSNTLNAGLSYPAITVTVDVESNASSPQVNQVNVSGGDSPTANASDSTVIIGSPALSITSMHSGNFTQGQQNATYTVTVSNGASAGATSGTVTVTETLPSGLTLVSTAGTGWACATNTCSTSNVLTAGSSYPAITVTVNVASNASSPQVNQVSVAGGGSASANASDSTVIIAIPVLSITSTHTGSFTQGQQNATYTLTVSNGASAGPTSGTVTVTETLPSGLTLVSMAGSGWTCTTNTCSTSNVLTAGSSYPIITVTVNVASNASSPQVNQVSVSGGGSATASGTDSTIITPISSGPAASFVGTDTTTKGSWQGKYGADGYSIANTSYQSLPSYATFSSSGTPYTWTSGTSDPRALAIPGGSGSVASCWYNASSFSFNVNITDGNTHQIALYALDWDSDERAETITIVEANNPSIVLSTQTVSSFNGGTYLVWDISGDVQINITRTGGQNAVISGVFFGTSTETPTAPLITSANSTTFVVGSAGTFTVTASGYPAPALTEAGSLPTGVTFNTTTNVLSGTPASGTNGSYPLVFTATNSAGTNTQDFTLTVSPASTATASFVGTDTTTQGAWQAKYGATGYSIANTTYQVLPSYATFTPTGTPYTWSSGSTDPRALAIPGGSEGVASCWYNAASFSFNVNITDGNTHQIALYALDWDTTSRAETITIVEANNPSIVLSTQTVSSFNGGTYLVWNISGDVQINITRISGVNAVISGVFFK
jgi:uncharacterized repeat protein (TIGR01451 family)